VLSALGGIVGVLLSQAVMMIGNLLLPAAQFSLSTEAVLVACVVSLLVGVGFGLYPANRAAQMDPIQALRFE
jgi:putative ABC transport system permease protein